MFNLKSTLAIAAIAFAAVPVAAHADGAERFESEFNYDRTAPVEQTYASFEAQSQKACKRQLNHVKSVYVRQQFLKQCSSELLDNVITRMNDSTLIRFHAQRKGETPRTQLAQRGK